jgi:UDP-glucuronate 4-epimerase
MGLLLSENHNGNKTKISLMKKILVTGAAGFIGFHLSKKLLDRGDQVIGLDNLNDYYDVNLKNDRLQLLQDYSKFSFVKIDLADRKKIASLFENDHFNYVVNLAAQAGVRYSIKNPNAYVDSNLVGFTNILEGCRYNQVEHLVFASSSSVYGANTKMPFSVHDNVDHPLSLYAATKKANELMAHTYSHLFNLPTTGLRFFTVYGPWNRPDMALSKFTKAILEGRPIQVFNHGKHRRDFTYIDDIVEGVTRVLDSPPTSNPEWNGDQPDPGSSICPWRIYNIGNNQPVELIDYISALENELGKIAEKEFLPLQAGDVLDTYADVTGLIEQFRYKPSTPMKTGINSFVKWYRDYYGV